MVKGIRWPAVLTLVALLTVTSSANAGTNSSSQYIPGVVEMVFSFDTTGSMYAVLEEVRQVVSDMIQRLQSDIPGIRIAVFAHGDYEDVKHTYATTFIDFTTDAALLQHFVTSVSKTSGGDLPECYELVLYEVSRNLSWTPGSRRSLVMIGDDQPHKPTFSLNTHNINWVDEAHRLKDMGVSIYAIRDAKAEARTRDFYQRIANITDGVYLKLEDFGSIIKFIMAISYREYGLEYLKAYEAELRKGDMTEELEKLFSNLRSNPVRRSTRTQMTPTRVKPVTHLPALKVPPVINVFPAKDVRIRIFHVQSDISYRWAVTSVTTKYTNYGEEAREATFNVLLPKSAFISNFTMILGNKSYPGVVKEKQAARKAYNAARARGESAGHIATTARDTSKFKVSVNLASKSDVTFVLIYEELLSRHHGVYKHIINIDPGTIVPDLQVAVNVHESRDLTSIHVPELVEGLLNSVGPHTDNPLAIVTRLAPNKARIVYRPTREQQKDRIAAGVHGLFVVEYDVVRTVDAGEIQMTDGYFVHYLAPDGLTPNPKSIIFVLDTSGSMYDGKLRQLKDSMTTIMPQLRPSDYFNVITFSSFCAYWKERGLYPATEENKKHALEWLMKMPANGATDINGALLAGIQKMSNAEQREGTLIPLTKILIFLTDGDPTAGEQHTDIIMSNIRNANEEKIALFTIAFGDYVNIPFVKKLSLQNGGFVRKIYSDSDAALQLSQFYTEIGTPTLSSVRITYLDDEVDNSTLTETAYQNYFDGSEIIITGKMSDPNTAILNVQVMADGASGPWSHSMTVMTEDTEAPANVLTRHNLQRMWAYLTIKRLLDRTVQTTSPSEKIELQQKVLELSLKYHFVTPLTSMVVVKPNPNEVKDTKDEESEEEDKEKAPKTSAVRVRGHKVSSPAMSHGPRAYADSDPHFIVHIQGSSTPVCFDVMGIEGQIFNLVYDFKSGIVVNGLIVGKTSTSNNKDRTYFGKIAIHHKNTSIILTPYKIRIGKIDINWKTNTKSIRYQTISLTLVEKNTARIQIDGGTEFVVIRHLVREDHPVKVSFLGFYIHDDRGMSAQAHGLLGQFKQLQINVNSDINQVLPKSTATLHFPSGGRSSIRVTAGQRENLQSHTVVPCWFVHNNGRKFIDGRHLDYLIPHIGYRRPPTNLIKKGIIDGTQTI